MINNKKNIKNKINLITPNWPAPKNISAFSTTRYLDNINLLDLPDRNYFKLHQTHSNYLINLNLNYLNNLNHHTPADGVFTSEKNTICAVRTADCLPILICDQLGEWVAAIHAGWKGIQSGIIKNAINNIPVDPKNLLVWLGPAISAEYYPVKNDMKSLFDDPEDQAAFTQIAENQYLCDIKKLAIIRLNQLNILTENIYNSPYCTYSQPDLFPSYRRDGASKSNRIMTLIWKD